MWEKITGDISAANGLGGGFFQLAGGRLEKRVKKLNRILSNPLIFGWIKRQIISFLLFLFVIEYIQYKVSSWCLRIFLEMKNLKISTSMSIGQLNCKKKCHLTTLQKNCDWVLQYVFQNQCFQVKLGTQKFLLNFHSNANILAYM